MKALLIGALLILAPAQAYAVADTSLVYATVTQVTRESEEDIPGTRGRAVIQELVVTLETGESVSVFNDRMPLSVGDGLYVMPTDLVDGPQYTVHDVDRTPVLLYAVLLFAFVIIVVGRWVGVRALISLVVSLGFILYALIPLLSSGYPPVLVSVVGAAVILGVAMALTHGIGRMWCAAYGGALVAVLVAIGVGEFFVYAAHLSGFADGAATTVSLTLGSAINMQGLLLGALIIGVLGIVDDLAITQVATVAELRSTGVHSARELYARAMHIGREHLGAVVNTLVLAYAGASLPLLILFSYAPAPTMLLINSEVIAVEIIRAAVGGIALAIVIPVATYLGILLKPEAHKGHTHH